MDHMSPMQIETSVKRTMSVMRMLTVAMALEVTHAPATLVTKAMDSHVMVEQ